MVLFETLIENLANIGFYNFFLPFILVVAVVYGVLKKTEFFKNNSIEAVVSISVGFLALGGMYLIVPADFFPQMWGGISVALVAILGIAIIMGMFGVKIQEMGGAFEKPKVWNILLLIIAAIIVGIIVFGGFFDLNNFSISWPFNTDATVELVMSILLLAVLVIAIWFITKESS